MDSPGPRNFASAPAAQRLGNLFLVKKTHNLFRRYPHMASNDSLPSWTQTVVSL